MKDLLDRLQAVVQVVQQWLSHSGNAENLVLVQSMRLMSQQPQSGAGGLEDSWRAAGLLSELES